MRQVKGGRVIHKLAQKSLFFTPGQALLKFVL